MNIWNLIKVITFGVILGVFCIGVPAVWIFKLEPEMPLGIGSAVAGILAVVIYNWYQRNFK